MSNKDRTIIIIVITLLTVISVSSIGHLRGKVKSLQAQLDQVPSIEAFQRMIGAKPDGIPGPETIRKWKEALEKQDKILFNQYANEYFTPTGAPKEMKLNI